MQKADRDRWDSIWIEHGDPEGTGWDYLSEVVFRVLEKEIGGLTGKSIAETGSGSGRISLRLARGGARPALFDYSGIAIDRSRGIFQAEGLKAFFIRSDIARIPVRNGSYDVVWNAGVMEHFDYDAQAAVLRDLIGICKAGGMVITLNPYSRSFLYASAKAVLSALGRWAFGREYPIGSIKEICASRGGWRIMKEYPIGFIVLFVDAYKFLPEALQRLSVIRALTEYFIRSARRLERLDKFLSRLFGGYLLVSVIRKDGSR